MWRQVQGSGRRSSSPMLAKKGSKTGHVLAPARPQLGRPMPCEHSKWRIGKGMGGQRVGLASWCSRRGASKITGEQSELRCFGCSIHQSAWKRCSPNFASRILHSSPGSTGPESPSKRLRSRIGGSMLWWWIELCWSVRAPPRLPTSPELRGLILAAPRPCSFAPSLTTPP